MTRISNLPEFDAVAYLDSEAAISAYLADALQANDSAFLAAARADIARARIVHQLATAIPADPLPKAAKLSQFE